MARRSQPKGPHRNRPGAEGPPAQGGLRLPVEGERTVGFLAGDLPRWYWPGAGALALVLLTWLYLPTFIGLVRSWNIEPDYSHGFLVAPFAVFLLWLRRDSFPATSRVPGWGGLALLAAGFIVRYAGERLFLAPLSAWGMVFWLTGAVWLLAGRRVMIWALPGLLFLLFMIPLPFRIEQLMSWHLQTVTTLLSTAMLECLRQPAIAEGHTVYLGDNVLEIEQACSGLRMFMGISAVAFAFVVLHQRPWWEKLILIAAVAPVAMLSNAIRVVVTGLLMQLVSDEAARRFSHDVAGWGMILVAAGLFGLIVLYLRKLVVAVDYETGRQLLRRSTSL